LVLGVQGNISGSREVLVQPLKELFPRGLPLLLCFTLASVDGNKAFIDNIMGDKEDEGTNNDAEKTYFIH